MINYTDEHTVDEDMMTMPAKGGHWNWNGYVGMMLRNMNDSPNYYVDDVAPSTVEILILCG